MNEKPLHCLFESIIKDGEEIVYWDLDPERHELREYVSMASVVEERAEYCDGYDGYGQWTPQFEYRYCTGKIKMPFTKEDYLDNDDIIDTVVGLGLDIETFWFALVFIFDFVESSFNKESCIVQTTSLNKAVQELFKELGQDFSDKEIEITLKKNKKNVEVLPVVKRGILQWLRETYERDCKDKRIPIFGADFVPCDQVSLNSSHRIYRAVGMYRYLFSNLLGNKRPKQPDKSVSLNRLLLISRICYLYKFTANPSYLYSDDSIKGIIKSYKGQTLNTRPYCYL